MSSDYTMTITGPDGMPVMVMQMDATLRTVRSASVDDAQMQTLLVVTSVAAGTVEGECIRQRAAFEQPGTANGEHETTDKGGSEA